MESKRLIHCCLINVIAQKNEPKYVDCAENHHLYFSHSCLCSNFSIIKACFSHILNLSLWCCTFPFSNAIHPPDRVWHIKMLIKSASAELSVHHSTISCRRRCWQLCDLSACVPSTPRDSDQTLSCKIRISSCSLVCSYTSQINAA